MNDPPITSAFAAVAELGYALGVRDVKKMPGCWEHQVDDNWWIALNAHDDERESTSGVRIPARTCYVSYGELPVGFIGPFGGEMIVGAEADFIAAVKAAQDHTSRKERVEPQAVVATRLFNYSWMCECGRGNWVSEVIPGDDLFCARCQKSVVVGEDGEKTG